MPIPSPHPAVRGALSFVAPDRVPGPVGGVVRRLALLWVILGICLAGWIMFALWTIVSSSHFYAYRADLSTVLSLSILLATAVFALGSVPPLWSLSKRPR